MINQPTASIPLHRPWHDYLKFSTDHKVIGIQYLLMSFCFFLVAGLLAMIIRAELLTPQLDVVDRSLYNGLFTLHGTIMIFLWVFPANVGLANYLIPLMIGARDVAFPVLNAIAFWLMPVVGVLLIGSFFLPTGTAQAGWWSYPPVSIQNPSGNFINGEFIWLLAVATSGISSIMGGVNFVTTVWKLRAPGLTLLKMPVYVWTILSAQILQLFCLPALTGGAVMLLFDLSFGTTFFDPFNQGNPIIYQHLFWFYSHPAVYVMALPAFGVFSEILPVFARKPLFGYKTVAISSFLIAIQGTFVWVHHMFTSATPNWMRMFFMASTMLIAVPTGIKVLAWTATVWRGSLRLKTPMLFCLGGILMFLFAGITGIMLASAPFDLHVNNTYFVVGHFHYVVFGTVTMAIYGAIYFWFPKMTGRMYNEAWGKLHFALTFIGANLNFFPMHPIGLQGMLRRISSYDPEYTAWNVVASLGAFLLGMSTLPFIANMVASAFQGRRVGNNPWNSLGLEWTTPSPPPEENFEVIPTITVEPYGYDRPVDLTTEVTT